MEEDNSTVIDDILSSQPIEFILLLIFEILSIPCTILILFYLFKYWNRMIRKALRNHAILLLTIISFLYITLDLPFTINSYRIGYDNPRTIIFCHWWYWIDYTLIIISLFLTAIASIQRHMLIFNAHLLNISRNRLIFHYIPLIIGIIYPPIFYLIVIFFYSCEDILNDDNQYCIVPCYSLNVVLFNIDWMMNTMIPVIIIIIANIALVYRVVRSLKKFPRKQSLVWKRRRKLTLELLIISLLYAIGWVPSIIVAFLQQFFFPDLIELIPFLDYFNYLTYFVGPLQPFICLIVLTDLIKSIKNFIRRLIQRSMVRPATFVIHVF